MKKVYVLALLASVILSDCTKELMSEANSDGEQVLVHLNLGGEIDIEDMPLTKAFTTDDLIGVQVYQGSDYYAYGLFDDVSKMSLFLHTGKTYKFVCTVVKNGKSIVYKATNSGWANTKFPVGASDNTSTVFYTNGNYLLPFIGKKNDTDSGYYSRSITNKFVYSEDERFHFTNLQYGTIASGTSESSYKRYPKADRYYGEVSGYTTEKNTSLSIPLRRTSYKVSLSVSGITDGSVTVTIKNSTQTFHTNSGITQDTQFGTTTWSFFDLKSAWQYADNYAENFTVGVVWNRGVGVTQDLGTKAVQFKRNAVNHVKINLSTSTKSAGLALSLEEPEITNETYSFGN